MSTSDGQPPLVDQATVIDWLEHRLEPAEAARVAELVQQGEPTVVATVAWWRRFTAAAAVSAAAEPVPQELAARLRSMSPAPAGPEVLDAPDSLSHRVRQLLGSVRATVSFDSLSLPALSMARSGADATRQLVLTAPGVELALDLDPQQGGTTRTALQVLPEDETADPGGVRVQVWSSGGQLRDASADDVGGLDLGLLPQQVVVLEVGAGDSWPAVHAELDLRRST